ANVAAACLGIQDGIQPDGLLAINADDTLLKKQIRKLKVPTASYAIENKKADCFANNIKLTHSGTVFDLNYKGKTVQIKIASLGNHNVYNAMSSYIAGDHLELTEEEIVKGIESHKPEGLRQNLVTLNGRVFYIDCFNASVETMSAAVKIISDTSMESPEGKRIAILGSISELGAEKVRGHSKVGQAILKSNIDILICLGDGAGIIADVAKAKPGLKVFKAMDQRHLAQLLQEETASGDLILVKGSRTASLETAVDAAFGTYFTLDAQEKSDPPTITYGKFKANMYKAHTTITGYSGEKSTIAIADILVWKEGKQGVYNIFGIGEGAFKDKDFLKTIYLENPLKVIGKQAFSNCPNLAKILIPPSVVNIADDAFENSPVTIHGIVGSYAHEYAKKHGIEFAEHVETPKVTTFATVPIENITDTGSMVLVNYNNPLKEIPDISSFGLADLAVSVATPKTIYANEHALGAAQHFINTARDDEVGEMVVVAGFRDHSQQNYLYERNPKDGRTAKPHNSEHHTGLALDIFIRGIRQHEMEGSPQAKWLADNAHRFGLILRYPKGKEEITGVPHEPWHFRFVGKAHAHYMWENEMVFEEYLDFLKEKRNITVDIYGSKYQVFYQQPQDGGILVPNEFKCTVSGDNQGGYIITEDRHPALY
ncbi:MAG: D-alanyl-D-alanine carboxypeptidase family protein, partial [Defluviitaleaceae bacterium]|nr:D-alanyl-D-alanine carboxypeptidase family protein [Defluviitaleaceae bacterium]